MAVSVYRLLNIISHVTHDQHLNVAANCTPESPWEFQLQRNRVLGCSLTMNRRWFIVTMSCTKMDKLIENEYKNGPTNSFM